MKFKLYHRKDEDAEARLNFRDALRQVSDPLEDLAIDLSLYVHVADITVQDDLRDDLFHLSHGISEAYRLSQNIDHHWHSNLGVALTEALHDIARQNRQCNLDEEPENAGLRSTDIGDLFCDYSTNRYHVITSIGTVWATNILVPEPKVIKLKTQDVADLKIAYYRDAFWLRCSDRWQVCSKFLDANRFGDIFLLHGTINSLVQVQAAPASREEMQVEFGDAMALSH